MTAPLSSSAPPESSVGGGGLFLTTHWSVVLTAQDKSAPDSQEALEALCRAYWYPLYAYVRRTGHSPADAEDLTQGFFARLLEKDYLRSATHEKGRFRTFLLVALKRFMANEWDREHAQKRGGFTRFLTIDSALAESRLMTDPASGVDPECVFDQQWARTVLERTLARLREEYQSSGRAELFEQLAGSLSRESSAVPYSAIAERLHLTTAAVKMAVHRLRSRFRELLLVEVGGTVFNPEDARQEVHDLFAAFAG